jgi:hypothetical protein
MDWKLGFFRLWIFGTAAWLLAVGYFAFSAFDKRAPFRGDYQYSVHTKEMPWNTDWSKPLYEIINPPGMGRFPDEFAPVEEQYIQQWDKDVKSGKMVTIDFPDFTTLYLSAEFTKADQTYLSGLFWQQRWYRYLQKIAPWLAWALLPPLALFILGLALAWVHRGFARKPAR